MPTTKDDLVLKFLSDDFWETMQEIVFKGNKDTFVVPKGFITDLASIPRIAAWLIPAVGDHNLAAVLHDLLWRISKADYERRLSIDGVDIIIAGKRYSRSLLLNPVDVDGIFRKALKEAGVGFLRRWYMWAAVRAAAIMQGRVGSMKLSHWLQLAAAYFTPIFGVSSVAYVISLIQDRGLWF